MKAGGADIRPFRAIRGGRGSGGRIRQKRASEAPPDGTAKHKISYDDELLNIFKDHPSGPSWGSRAWDVWDVRILRNRAEARVEEAGDGAESLKAFRGPIRRVGGLFGCRSRWAKGRAFVR